MRMKYDKLLKKLDSMGWDPADLVNKVGVSWSVVMDIYAGKNVNGIYINRIAQTLKCDMMDLIDIDEDAEEVQIQPTKGKNTAVYKCNKDGKILNKFDSMQLAAKSMGKTTHSAISECVNGKRKTAYGFKWKRAEK